MRLSPRLLLLIVAVSVAAGSTRAQSADRPSPPAIHGPLVFGARPHHPFLYRVPITGTRPIHVSATGLPAGLTLDPADGIIRGTSPAASTAEIELQVSNPGGTAHRRLTLVIGDQLALTPPMGWSAWDRLQTGVSTQKIQQQADALLRSGLADHGYTYINIDDGWQYEMTGPRRATGDPRNPDGTIRPNAGFPDMAALTASLHRQGLKAGLYTSPGPLTCAGYEGSAGHVQQDALTYATWGFDFLKYDLCSYHANSADAVREPYAQMGRLLASSSRDMLFSISSYGRAGVETWGREVGAQMWRTGDDLAWGPKGVYSTWDNIVGVLRLRGLAAAAGPGGWNDPDDLVIGQIAYIPFNEKPPDVTIDRVLPPPLTPDEQIAQMSLWSMMAAPLIIGGDLTTLDEFSVRILSNDEVIAVDQDPLGRAGHAVSLNQSDSVWVRDLADGSHAVALLNLGDRERELTATWSELGLTGPQTIRDLWKRQDIGAFNDSLTLLVPPHGVRLLLASAVSHSRLPR